ncbi:hypothetical protein NIES4071_37760 [Calothrix sp. NIES-4071]|nr:hypothetical protein NIES4071_37760 [Calothrix sp. NIES-4071]BAZ58093.1 hypothetical protein NIES4105_37690 [Calothrix sp. NIES-4105]
MNDEIQRADYDSPWKDILETYFQQAMEFFFPKTAALIDWSVPYVFLDKEFQAISYDAEQGRRYADKLVKVRYLSGKDAWLLIHIEIQGEKEDEFPLRIYTYNFRILDRYKTSAISLAILCDSDKNWHPSTFCFTSEDTTLYFKFGSVKLLKYQRRFKQLQASNNVFATVVMAHLRTQQTRSKPSERKRWKLSLIRELYDQGLSEQDIRNLYKFIDWVMILPEGLENEFWEDFKKFEQERKMTYMTTGERIGEKRGQLNHAKSLVLRQLTRLLGEVSEQNRATIEFLTLEKLDALGEALLDFSSTDDLLRWLQQNQ